MDKNEIYTKTNYWYYAQVIITAIIFAMIPVVLFTDFIINYFTK